MSNIIVNKTSIPISKKSGNSLVRKNDGYYAASTGVEISKKENNALVNETDGLYVEQNALSELSVGNGLKFVDNTILLDEEVLEETEDVEFNTDEFRETVSDVEITDEQVSSGDDDINFEGM